MRDVRDVCRSVVCVCVCVCVCVYTCCFCSPNLPPLAELEIKMKGACVCEVCAGGVCVMCVSLVCARA